MLVSFFLKIAIFPFQKIVKMEFSDTSRFLFFFEAPNILSWKAFGCFLKASGVQRIWLTEKSWLVV